MVVWPTPEAPPPAPPLCRLPPAGEPLKAPAGSELGSPPWSSPLGKPAPPPFTERCGGSCPTSAQAATLSFRRAAHRGSGTSKSLGLHRLTAEHPTSIATLLVAMTTAVIYDSRFIVGLIAAEIPTPNAATRRLQHRSVAVDPQTESVLLGSLVQLRSSQPEWLLEVAPQLRSRQVLAPAYCMQCKAWCRQVGKSIRTCEPGGGVEAGLLPDQDWVA